MPCPKVSKCPLFPELTLTLEVWRTVYCDDENGWRKCARFQLSSTGQDVPITLLPSGKNLPPRVKKA